MDAEGEGTISLTALSATIKDYRLALNAAGLKALGLAFDSQKKGVISYREFIKAVLGKLSTSRRRWIRLGFHELDQHKSRVVSATTVKDKYNAKHHPDVLHKRRTELDVAAEFADCFDAHATFYADSLKDQVTLAQFEDFYSFVGATMPDDRHFSEVMIGTWDIHAYDPLACEISVSHPTAGTVCHISHYPSVPLHQPSKPKPKMKSKPRTRTSRIKKTKLPAQPHC